MALAPFFPSSVLCLLFRWHWRSFVIGGGSAFWVLAYGLFYWASRLKLDSLSGVVLYLGYLFLIAVFDFLITGILVPLEFLPVLIYCLQERLDSWRLTGLYGNCIVRFVLISCCAVCCSAQDMRYLDNRLD